MAGKTNTIFAWETWQTPEKADEPAVWFHDIFRRDGTPYDAKETAIIRAFDAGREPRYSDEPRRGMFPD